MATRCQFGKVKSGPRKGRCRKVKSRSARTVKGVCLKFSRTGRKRKCLKRAPITRKCVQRRKGGCRRYEYDAKSVGFEGTGLLGLGLFGIL